MYEKNFDIVDQLSEKFHVPGTFDLFLPILFALAGEPEVFSDEYTECLRNPDWKNFIASCSTSVQRILFQ